jgi:putative peptidoglycan lipid II flippase
MSRGTAEQKTVVSTAVVMVSTLASRLFGFVRIAVIGAIFGASGEADVLNLVFNIPNNLRKLLAEGALSSAFIPALTRAHVEDPQGQRARGIVQRLIGLQVLILVPLLGFATLFPGSIVGVILDFPEAARQSLAAGLFQYLIHYVLLISLAAVLMGTLNSEQRFLVPAVAPLWFSIAVIAAVVTLHRSLGVYSMVAGVLVGGFGQLLIQVPSVLRLGYSLRPRFSFRDPHFQLILRRWLPVVSTASVFAINQQIALFFASGLEDGSGSAMTNALVFWQLPFGIFSASITTVLFPAMSRHAAAGDDDALARSVTQGVRGLVLLLIPAGIGLIVLGEPIIAVALQRGAFLADDTHRAARVLTGYSLGLFSVGAFTFLQRFFYACDNYRTPLAVATLTMIADVGLSLWLKETQLRVAGLSVANSLAFSGGLVVFLILLRQRGPAFRLAPLVRPTLIALIASAGAVGTVTLVRRVHSAMDLSRWWLAGSSWKGLGLLFTEALPALAALYLVYHIFGIRVVALLRGRSASAAK